MYHLSAISSLSRFLGRRRQAIVRASAPCGAVTLEAMESRQLLTVTPSFVPVTISAAAIAADSKLATCKSFDLMVNVTSGDDWASGDLKLNLSGGTFYVPSQNSDIPQKSQFASKPNLQYDTFVSSPNFNQPFVLGVSYLSTGTNDAVFSTTAMDVAWGDLTNNGAGTFTIARLTVTNGATATLQGRVGSISAPSSPKNFTFSLNAGGGGTTTASIAGTVYNDINGNGSLQSGETGIAGRTIYIDANSNNTLDTNETRVTTNSSGGYTFSNLAAGPYKVREVVPSGWTQTSPASNASISFSLTAGQKVTGKNFLTKPNSAGTGSIAGTVYNDLNGSGTLNTGETGIAGRTLFLDANSNNALDTNEQRVITDSNGNYKFSNLGVTTYKVREIVPGGWTQTNPASNASISVTLAAAQVATAKNFFTKPNSAGTGSIAGTVYNDLNGNGSLQSGEPGLANRIVYIDKNSNNTLDTDEVRVVTSSTGAYKLSNLGTGTMKVREVVPSGWTQTNPVSNGSISVTLASAQAVTAKNFFVRQTNASIAGNVFQDLNRNGSKNTGEGILSGWTVYIDSVNNNVLDSSEVRVTTDSSGNFKFSNLAAGTYEIRIVLKSGFVQTLPGSNGSIFVTVSAGQAVTGKAFGADN